MSYFWIALAIVLIVVECLTVQLLSIWTGISAAVTAVLVAIFPSIPVPVQILIFLLLSAALLAATRPFVKKFLRRKKGQETNLELLMDQPAVVVETINNIAGAGQIKIQGKIWSARSIDNTEIPVDTVVIFRKIEGNKAIVSLN